MKKWITKDYGLPFLTALFLIIYPWITIKCEIGISDAEYALFDSRVTGLLDLFLKGKSVFLVIFAFIFLAVFAYMAYKKKNAKLKYSKAKKAKKGNYATVEVGLFNTPVKKERILIIGAIFIFLNILSFVLSEYKEVAFRGNSNSLEGLFQVLSYCVIFVAALMAFAKEENLVYLKISGIVLGIITIILSLIEILYEPLSKIIIGDSWSSEYVNMTVLTFYNSVYFAAFLAMLTPVIFAIFLFETNIKLSLISGVIFVGLFIVNITSRSTMSLYVVIAAVIALIAVKVIQLLRCRLLSKTDFSEDNNNDKKAKNKKAVTNKTEPTSTKKGYLKFIIAIVFVALLLICNLASGNTLFKTVSATGSNQTTAIHKDNYYKLCDIENKDGAIVFTGEDSSFTASVDEKGNVKFDSSDDMAMTTEGNVIKFGGKFDAVSAWFEGGYLTVDLGYQEALYFAVTEEGIVPVRPDGRMIEDMSGNGVGLESFYSIATGRGYYWANSLPIIKNCIIVGHGLGTFGLCFNQTDFVGSLNTHGTVYTLVDHPHNMYIQIAVQTGVISLISIAAICIISLICGVKKIRVSEQIADKGLLIGVFTAVLCFMVCSLTTDSMLTTTPIFCVLLGALTGSVKHANSVINNK